MGTAVPHRIGRHVHPDARPTSPRHRPPPTGIDYLHLVAAAHHRRTGRPDQLRPPAHQHDPDRTTSTGPTGPARRPRSTARSKPSWPPSPRSATTTDGQLPGQLDLTELADDRRSTNPAPRRRAGIMTIDRLTHYGFTRTPFGKNLAPQMLHRHKPTPRPSPGSAGASPNTPSA